MNIYENISRLASYGVRTGLIEREDVAFVKNRLLSELGLDGFENDDEANSLPEVSVDDLEEILSEMLDYAQEKGVAGPTKTHRDIFDTKLMAVMVSKPSEISREFWSRYERSAKEATDFFYKFSQDTDYIRRYRIR